MPFDVRAEADLLDIEKHLKACVSVPVKAPRVLNVAEILQLKVSKPESLINGILPAVKQIETSAILATVDFNMFKIGCTATLAAVRYLRREPAR